MSHCNNSISILQPAKADDVGEFLQHRLTDISPHNRKVFRMFLDSRDCCSQVFAKFLTQPLPLDFMPKLNSLNFWAHRRMIFKRPSHFRLSGRAQNCS